MKTVTVNGVDHELSPDSPRATSHSALLQDIVTAVNKLEVGTSPDGLELTSADATKNVITSASDNTTTDGTTAAMTFHNTVAHATNDLEFNFTKSDNTSLLKVDKEGDTTILGDLAAVGVTATGALSAAGISSSGATTALTSTSANLITGATSDANTSGAVAGMTFKNTTAHTAGDLEFDFQNSTAASLLHMDNTGAVTASGSVASVGGFTTSALAAPVSGSFTTAGTGGTLLDSTHYFYRISAYNAVGETLACTEVDKSTAANAGANTATITAVWGTVPGAAGYKVYGRTTGAEQLIATVGQGTLSYMDTGSVSPSGALPAINTTGVISSEGVRVSDFTDDSATAGDRTVNKHRGVSKIASGQTAITITNAFCTATSLVLATLQTDDATAILKSVVPSAGSFLITIVAATGDTKVAWTVIN